MSHPQLYLVEARDAKGNLDFEKESQLMKAYPYLFSRRYFTIDDLAWWVSYGQPQLGPSGPSEARAFLASIGACIRPKTW